MNTEAKSFIPESVKIENEYFDKLEKEFVEANKWMFEAIELEVIEPKTPIVPNNTPIQETESKKSYAEIAKK